ncbi:Uncharacterised protein [Candidatus Norongarragalina meridionalis]|nr:Uncharacterised protein [Candidatus Norongarragalina meridionalis]
MKTCSSCGRQVKEYAEFKCPSCEKSAIVRCKTCRETSNPYRCGKCGFSGP